MPTSFISHFARFGLHVNRQIERIDTLPLIKLCRNKKLKTFFLLVLGHPIGFIRSRPAIRHGLGYIKNQCLWKG